MLHKMLRPDSKGRISLGTLAKGVSGFSLSTDKNNRIILEPYTEIPAREKWLFDNEEALENVKQGLKDAQANRIFDKGSFAKYIDDKIE